MPAENDVDEEDENYKEEKIRKKKNSGNGNENDECNDYTGANLSNVYFVEASEMCSILYKMYPNVARALGQPLFISL